MVLGGAGTHAAWTQTKPKPPRPSAPRPAGLRSPLAAAAAAAAEHTGADSSCSSLAHSELGLSSGELGPGLDVSTGSCPASAVGVEGAGGVAELVIERSLPPHAPPCRRVAVYVEFAER